MGWRRLGAVKSVIGSNGPQDNSLAKISFGEKLGYGVGDMANNLIWTAMSMFVTYFYTDVAGLAAGAVGTMFLIARVLDAFVDVGVGTMVDRTKSRYGKARPWLLWMCIPFGIAGVLLFTAPDLSAAGALAYAYVTYLLINIIYSAINIPYGVLSSMITQDPYQRSLLNIFRMVMTLIGILIVSTGTLKFVELFGGGKHGWTWTFGAFGSIAVILFIITFLTTKERVRPAVVEKQIPFKRGLGALFRNKYWVMILLLNTLFYGMQAVTSAVNVYYAQYLLGNKDLVGLLSIVQLIPMMLGLLLLAPIIKRFGKRNAALTGMGLMVIGSLIPTIDPDSLTVVIIATVVKALGQAPLMGTIFAFTADTVDYGEWKTGMRTEGLIFSASSFGGKTGTGFGGAMVGWILAFSGYVGGQTALSGAASQAIQFLYIFLPAILCALCAVILWFYRLDKEYPKILLELQEVKQMG